jgi:hypothetical protein
MRLGKPQIRFRSSKGKENLYLCRASNPRHLAPKPITLQNGLLRPKYKEEVFNETCSWSVLMQQNVNKTSSPCMWLQRTRLNSSTVQRWCKRSVGVAWGHWNVGPKAKTAQDSVPGTYVYFGKFYHLVLTEERIRGDPDRYRNIPSEYFMQSYMSVNILSTNKFYPTWIWN